VDHEEEFWSGSESAKHLDKFRRKCTHKVRRRSVHRFVACASFVPQRGRGGALAPLGLSW
jgi:hypothetical protein